MGQEHCLVGFADGVASRRSVTVAACPPGDVPASDLMVAATWVPGNPPCMRPRSVQGDRLK